VKKSKKPLPKWVPFVIAVFVPLLVGFGGYKFVVAPKNAQAKDLAQKTADIQTQIATYKAQAAQPQAKTPKIKYADVYRLQQALPNAIRVPDLILELDRVADDAGIQFDAISFPAAPAPAGTPYNAFPVSLSFSGDFYTITDLLYRLRSLVSVRHGTLDASGPLISVDSVGLTPAAEGTKLSANVSITAYTYVPAAPAAPASAVTVGGAPAPGATTTSTDTTATTTTPTSTTSAAGAP
jgi:Tfp pilus assembly protein PilO